MVFFLTIISGGLQTRGKFTPMVPDLGAGITDFRRKEKTEKRFQCQKKEMQLDWAV